MLCSLFFSGKKVHHKHNHGHGHKHGHHHQNHHHHHHTGGGHGHGHHHDDDHDDHHEHKAADSPKQDASKKTTATITGTPDGKGQVAIVLHGAQAGKLLQSVLDQQKKVSKETKEPKERKFSSVAPRENGYAELARSGQMGQYGGMGGGMASPMFGGRMGMGMPMGGAMGGMGMPMGGMGGMAPMY